MTWSEQIDDNDGSKVKEMMHERKKGLLIITE